MIWPTESYQSDKSLSQMSTGAEELATTRLVLSPPPLSDLVPILSAGLTAYFAVVEVSVCECPDLRAAPFHLAAPGLSGNPCVADVGGQDNLRPTPDLSKTYDLLSVSRLMGMAPEQGLLIGAAAGPFHVLGQNTELIPNISYRKSDVPEEGAFHVYVENLTRYAKIVSHGDVCCERIEHGTTGFGLMANLYGSDGLPGAVLRVKTKSRIGKLNFPHAIQNCLSSAYGEKLISVGGVFVLRQGKTHLHVMPDFAKEPVATPEQADRWLKYFDAAAPLTCLSVFHSGHDGTLGLRREHTHCFTSDGSGIGGHYHYDLDETRTEVQYEGWFNVAEMLYRIDQPSERPTADDRDPMCQLD